MPGAEGSGEIPQTPQQKDKKPPVVKATDTQEKKPTLENRKNLSPDVRKTLDKLRPEDINVVKEVIPGSEIPQEMKREYVEWKFRKGEFFSNLTDGTKEFIRNVLKNKDLNELKRMKNIYIDKYKIDPALINDAFDGLTEKSFESQKEQEGVKKRSVEEKFLEYKLQQITSKIGQNSSEQKKSN